MRPFPPLLLLALVVQLCLPSPVRAEAQWQLRSFTTRDGLAHDIVRDVLEAGDGTLWFATMGGITRYHPAKCRYETIVPPPPAGGDRAAWRSRSLEVMALARGPDGAIWVAMQGGGVAVLRAGRWRRYTARDGLPSDEITSLMIDRQGRVWATPTTGGIALFAGDRWRAFGPAQGLAAGEIGRCTQRRDDTVLCGTYDRPMLQRFDGKRWTGLAVDAPVDRHFYVHDLAEGADGRLWLATKGVGVIEGRPRGRGYRWRVHDASSGLASDRVGAVHIARSGAVWFATSAGVSRYDGAHWRSFGRGEGLGANLVFAITETADGALWLATLGGGASRYAPSRWQRIDAADGLPSGDVTGGLLRARDGTLWVGTDRGLARRTDKRWESLRTESVAADHVNDLLQSHDGALWVATRDGLRRLHENTWQHFPADASGERGPRSPIVNHLAEDPRGRLWIATSDGVSWTDGSHWHTENQSDGLPSSRVYGIHVDHEGRVWAATSNGVARRAARRWVAELSPGPASRTNRIYAIVEDPRRRLWASGLDGVHRREGKRWHRVPPNRWLPEGIYSRFVMSTGDGSLWFAVRGLGVRHLREGRWTRYTSADGLAADTVSDVLRLPDGALLFATLGGGISRYVVDTHPPQTWIGHRGQRAPSSFVQGEQIQIHFGGQDVLKDTPTSRLTYSFRLDGGAWSPFAPRATAELGSLQPGAHRFAVRAMDRDLNVDPSAATHDFRVVRPWWAEPWLIGLVSLSLFGLVFGVVRSLRAVRRERQAMTQQQALLEQRRQFVRLASHELRKPLTRLAHRAELIALPETGADPERLGQYARALVEDSGRLARLVESLLHQARLEQGLQLAVQQAEIGQTVRSIVARVADDLAVDRPRVEITTGDLQVRLDPLYLELALRNLIDNACKYGDPASVKVTVDQRDGEVWIAVADKGPGIAPEERDRVFEAFHRGRTSPEHAGFGLGLSFARDIARAHGGDLLLEQSDEAGCRFLLTLPLSD